MTCPHCSAALPDTAKFCPECGTPRPARAEPSEDENLGRAIMSARSGPWFGAKEAEAVACKARELLCGPKDAEIARLKAELENAQHQLKYHDAEWSVLFELAPTDCPNDSHSEHVNKIAHEIKQLRTAAANARREALEELRQQHEADAARVRELENALEEAHEAPGMTTAEDDLYAAIECQKSADEGWLGEVIQVHRDREGMLRNLVSRLTSDTSSLARDGANLMSERDAARAELETVKVKLDRRNNMLRGWFEGEVFTGCASWTNMMNKTRAELATDHEQPVAPAKQPFVKPGCKECVKLCDFDGCDDCKAARKLAEQPAAADGEGGT